MNLALQAESVLLGFDSEDHPLIALRSLDGEGGFMLCHPEGHRPSTLANWDDCRLALAEKLGMQEPAL